MSVPLQTDLRTSAAPQQLEQAPLRSACTRFAAGIQMLRIMKKIISLMAAMFITAAAEAKTLVVYYSYTNNCHEIVTTLTSQIEADVVRIEPAEKGLKYEANNYALGTQLLNAIKANPNDASSYPAIDLVTVSLADYDTYIIVTPLWWSQMAAIMQTYLFHHGAQMAGKHVGLIVSSHSSGISGVVSDCKRLVPDGNYFSENLWINASNHSNRASLIQNWLTAINYASVTGIKAIDNGKLTIDNYYDLSGRRLMHAPTKGIYIVNGKKIIR